MDLVPAGTTTVRIWRDDGRTRAQRAADRYEVEELPLSPRGGRSWAVRDSSTGALVADDEGTVRAYSTPSGADGWRRSQVYLAGYRQMPGVTR
ncbi:hypothetical protein ACFWXO_39435 [Kitasatospora sp. NPDC059088]|uniref:hypothetical protein n=1 Tax=Kitasatospora sp. NPDC059088 TaxID=3346722 RepID=UPI0036C58391